MPTETRSMKKNQEIGKNLKKDSHEPEFTRKSTLTPRSPVNSPTTNKSKESSSGTSQSFFQKFSPNKNKSKSVSDVNQVSLNFSFDSQKTDNNSTIRPISPPSPPPLLPLF